MGKVLVTGANGYLATQVIAALLRQGRDVRGTVRSLDSEASVRQALGRGGVDDSGLELVRADLTTDDGWPIALAGVEEVHHVASPIPPAQPEDPNELIVPAREGTIRVLRSACDAGVRRVVLTSSFAAVGYSPKTVRDFTEADWTDPDSPGLPPYPRSKAIAERAAWDYVEQHGGDTELVVLNPTFIIGPSLVTSLRSSLVAIKAIAEGTMLALPRQRFGVADVRDVAEAHLKAASTGAAASKRYLLLADGPTITWLSLAEVIRDHLGASGHRVTLQEVPGEEPMPLVIHNDRAKEELDWQPRPVQTTITDTLDSLRELQLL
ncbi:MAG: NAD-dependent epimerase/dehydratase family protein [Actinomycetota bacterium]|nr:NAD-dependent epimerase/dehydratase family protein [Actinomycetota bacterium]